MLIPILLLIIGLAILVIYSNIFVSSAESLANNFKVPKMAIGLTIAAFCTCTPELAISFNSIQSNAYDVTLANVIGSLVINILLIIGLASIAHPIHIKSETIKKELPLLFITTVTFSLLFLDHSLSRIDALILILLFIVFCLYLYRLIKSFRKTEEEAPKYSPLTSIFLTILSLFVITIVSDLIVESTKIIAEGFNISEKIITMTVIVIGTSLPELVITVTSAKKGDFEMAVGNIIGTNIFNICIVLGLPTLIFGTITSNAFNLIDLSVTCLAAFMFFILSYTGKVINKKEGFTMLLIFIIYYAYLFS